MNKKSESKKRESNFKSKVETMKVKVENMKVKETCEHRNKKIGESNKK